MPGFETEEGAEFTAEIIPNPNCNLKICKKNSINKNNTQENIDYTYNSIADIIINSEKPLSVFPNPTTGYFYVTYNLMLDSEINYCIYDSFGRIISQNSTSERSFSVNLSNYQNGIYFLVVIANNNTYKTKIIKQ